MSTSFDLQPAVPSRKRFEVLRKPTIKTIAMLISVASLAALSASLAPASALATQRIDMKVLLLGTSATEPDFVSWQTALQREGVPYEAIVTSAGHTPITASTLSATLSNGTQEAKYQAVIVSVGDLPVCTETCTSTLTASEWTALEEYEQTFNVRQITGDVFPSATYGLNAPSFSGEFAEGFKATLTTEGKTVFPYLKESVATSIGTYGYEATPLATQATGASFTPLVTSSGGSALVGIYTHANGIQEMVETFDENADQMQAELLRHGALNWVTRGVYFGDQRNYVEMDIDDTFTPDDAWNTTTHEINYDNADSLRIKPVDVEYAAKWEKEHGGFRMEQLFNGGGSVEYAEAHSGVDSVLAKFQETDPETGKPYSDSFGWLSHTYDTPYMDVGCATQKYIEAELNENTEWAAKAPGTTAGTGGLGLTETTEPGLSLGYENGHVFVPGNHSGFADLVPGNPATVDEPEFDADEKVEEGKGTLVAGSYEYAITDEFVEGGGESAADVTKPLAVEADGAVTLEWQSICHAAAYKIYRTVAGTDKWSQIGTVSTPFSATLPDNSSGEAESSTNVKGGGELEQTFTDTGAAGTEVPGWTPPTAENAVESAWEQNPYFIPALEGVGITDVGDDASKNYPNPPTAEFGIGKAYVGPEYQAGETFLEGKAQVVPRHPINIYYNASTEAQEVDEWNTLFLPPSKGGQCENTSTTTCEEKAATFAEIIKSVVSGMFQNMMNNDPRPSYVHQTNIIGKPPVGEPTNSTPLPNTPEATGDGLLYSVLNPLLAEYSEYFNADAPYEQLTLAAIGNLLAEQQAWSKANASQVSGYIEGNQVTVDNSGSAINIPLTGVTSVGSSYGGIQSGWTSVAGGTSNYTAATGWPTAPETVEQAPQGNWIDNYGSAGYLLADWDGTQDISNMPDVTASLVQGSRYEWAGNTSGVQALEGPDGLSRDAACYFSSSQIEVQLSFASAYSGDLHLYAVDWDKQSRREAIVVNDGSGPREVELNSDFSQGAWVSFPINVSAGGTVTILVNKVSGVNAVLSGIFLGNQGNPPATTGQELSKGGWVGSVGSAGYDLAGWDGATGDASYMPNVSVTLAQGARYQWAVNTTDTRALSDPGEFTRNATAYTGNPIRVLLNFASAYSGNLHLYAVDWDKQNRRELVTVDGQTDVLSSDFSQGAWMSFPINVAAGGTVTITVDKTAGLNAVLSGIFLGDAGSPPALPVTNAPQGTWKGEVGSAGYLLPDWDGTQDLSNMPGVKASLLEGARYLWATNTSDVRALQGPDGLTRDAATYTGSQIRVSLNFAAAYTGNLHLYALDWDKQNRREIITVDGQTAVLSSDFSQGAWMSFPISVAAGGTVTITVDKTAGINAVLSGIFLGNAGAPPEMTVSTAPQGSWVGTFGSTGYDLAGWEGTSDLSSLPTGVTLNLAQGARYRWAAKTTEVRALQAPTGSIRNASSYTYNGQVRVVLNFTEAFNGNVELYAVDWDKQGRRELVTVNGQTAALSSEFTQGAWTSFPVSVAAGGTVTITVDKTAGLNAVLSGIFLN
jgi:hypothetical protein